MTLREKIEAKQKAANGAIVLFRMGAFYEAFNGDAEKLSPVLGLTLVHRDKEKKLPMVGFPYHQLDAYIEKIESNGLRAELVEDLG